MDMGFLNPSHLQGCAVTPVFLKTIDIPSGTRQTMLLESQTDPPKSVKIFAGARVSVQLQGEDGLRGPYYLGGYLRQRDVLVLGDIKGRPYEVAVTEITKLMVGPTNPVGYGAQRGAMVTGVPTAAFFFLWALAFLLSPHPGGPWDRLWAPPQLMTASTSSTPITGGWCAITDYLGSRSPIGGL